jgi:phytoene synthase
LARFGADLKQHDANFVRLMHFEAQRARDYYNESQRLIELIHKRSRPSLWALIQIYRRLLDRIERSDFDVLERRISLPAWEKLSIVARAAVM